MTNLPINMEIINDQNQLTLSSGQTEIDYFFSTNSITNTISDSNNEINYFSYTIVGGIIVIIIIVTIIFVRSKQKNIEPVQHIQTSQKNNLLDLETIFKLKPDLREDDKELVKFIFNSGGEVLESELDRKSTRLNSSH